MKTLFIISIDENNIFNLHRRKHNQNFLQMKKLSILSTDENIFYIILYFPPDENIISTYLPHFKTVSILSTYENIINTFHKRKHYPHFPQIKTLSILSQVKTLSILYTDWKITVILANFFIFHFTFYCFQKCPFIILDIVVFTNNRSQAKAYTVYFGISSV